MAGNDESIVVERYRDLIGRNLEPWVRRVLLAVLLVGVLLALAGVIGQVPRHSQVAGPQAVLAIDAPERLRGGLFFQARFTIRARRDVKEPQLVLGPGWFEGLTLNTVVPEPTEQSNRNGRVALVYDELAAGDTLRVRLQYQVNPTVVGRRVQLTELADGDRPLLTDRRRVTILP